MTFGTIGNLLAETEHLAVDEPLAWSKSDDMGFKIEGVCSYRGYYDQAAMIVSLVPIDCADNVGYLRKMLERLKSEEFCGWKGGEYKYTDTTDVYLVDEAGKTTFRNKPRIFKVKSDGTFKDKDYGW